NVSLEIQADVTRVGPRLAHGSHYAVIGLREIPGFAAPLGLGDDDPSGSDGDVVYIPPLKKHPIDAPPSPGDKGPEFLRGPVLAHVPHHQTGGATLEQQQDKSERHAR